jgi:hypothetical protein
VVNYVGCSMRVRILERSTVTFGEEVKRVDDNGRPHLHRVMRGTPIFEYPHASKIVQVVGKYDVDHFSVMKAETGAIGRALGMAGMLVIPGSGVATAEDMQEVPTAAATSPAAPPAQLPPEQVGESDDDIRAHVARNLTELAKYPEALAQFQEWARGRGLTTLEGLEGANLKGVARKLDRSLHEAKS